MKTAFIGTYPPRECGIGTFTNDLYNAMRTNPSSHTIDDDSYIIAISDHNKTYDYGDEVKFTIRQEHQRDYLNAADFINISGADVCVLQHEFGIFGGEDGAHILPLLQRLNIPVIVTLHTVLKTPSFGQKSVMQRICNIARKVVVMSHKAVDFLTTIYDLGEAKIELIEHGVPDIQFDQKKIKKEFNLEDKKLLLTFGLLGRSKGIETVIKALPKAIEDHPEVLYIVLGKTHPNVVRESGEEYRHYLRSLVSELNLENHVIFVNEYVNQQELFKYLSACDIYITPYINEAQITSGTLTYAAGAGAAILSTPYWHAAELLAEGKGKLFDFRDSDGLSVILENLLNNPQELKKLRKQAQEYGRNITWPKIGEKYVETAKEISVGKYYKKSITEKDRFNPQILPPFSLSHIKQLSDNTGILQHSKFGVPNLKEGYCLDDNARGLLMATMAYNQKKDELAKYLSPIYLSYMHYMQNDDGTFRNFLSFDRRFLDEVGSEDSFGRAAWALGYLLGNTNSNAYYKTAEMMFYQASQNFEKLQSIRGIANTMVGISHYLKSRPSDETMLNILRNLTNRLVQHYEENSATDWQWFEPLLAYDNGMLPLAMLHAAEIFGEDRIRKVALESLDFLTKNTLTNDYLSVIGNKNWYHKGGERSVFAQQPVDAMAMTLMYYQAFRLTQNKEYLEKLFTSFMWFLGKNEINASLYDFETKGCYDGFDQEGVNQNLGAESSLAYLISHLVTLQAFEKYEKH
ncbi:MAG: glycosyltransferase [Bacteroidales bacterium]|nr:glycosyltransferase [Bacteroidales bacterium]MCF8328087.1 glycosyltransferase [Bacteroidales bacterium]